MENKIAPVASLVTPRPRPASISRLWKPIAKQAPALLFALCVVAYWELHIRLFEVDALLLPPPSAVAQAFWSGMTSGLFMEHFQITLFRALSGFLLAATLGIAIGTLISQFRFFETTIYPWIIALQTVPKIAVAPLILVWFGYGSTSKIITAAMISLFPVLVNTIVGLKSCDQGKLDLMKSLGASRWTTFRMVQLPSALPYIFAGLNVAVVFSILGAIVGEFIGSQEGIGYLILDANFQLNIPRVFALLVLLAAFGMACFVLLQTARNRLLFWNK
ncbi:ABC transporter permease [Stutzerimonas azotifigens]|uniref:ABC transporter permease n=1 Tax=Stutzerimonas azotifigens TaxID=291995 RepID=UPI00040B1920|nr:ABC transporter permease [Stutzerimonas azotifigens]